MARIIDFELSKNTKQSPQESKRHGMTWIPATKNLSTGIICRMVYTLARVSKSALNSQKWQPDLHMAELKKTIWKLCLASGSQSEFRTRKLTSCKVPTWLLRTRRDIKLKDIFEVPKWPSTSFKWPCMVAGRHAGALQKLETLNWLNAWNTPACRRVWLGGVVPVLFLACTCSSILLLRVFASCESCPPPSPYPPSYDYYNDCYCYCCCCCYYYDDDYSCPYT